MTFKKIIENNYIVFEAYKDDTYLGRILFELLPSQDFIYNELDFIKGLHNLSTINTISEKDIKKYNLAFHLAAFDIDNEFQDMGFGTQLLSFAMEEIKKDMNNDFLYLNACTFSDLDLHKLASIYQKFGFEIYFEDTDNIYMINYNN